MNINVAKDQREPFESAMTSDDSFITALGALIAMEEMDHVEDYLLLECNAPSERKALPAVTAGQSNVQCSGCARRGNGSTVLDEVGHLYPIVRIGTPQRLTQTAGCAVDSIAGRIGLSVMGRSGPKRVADTPQLQALLEDLTDISATTSEGDGNIEEDTVAANVQCNGQLESGISSAVLDEKEQLCPIVSIGPPQKPTQAAGCIVDLMVARTGLPILRRSDPRRLVDAPQLQALLEDLTDPSATISEGDGNSNEDTVAANVQRTGHLGREISSTAMDEEA